MPGHINSIYQYQFDFIDDAGAAVDVSSYDFGMRFYQITPSHKCPVTITPGAGIDTTNAATGSIVVMLTLAQVREIGVGSFHAELYKNYSNESLREVIFDGGDSIEGHRFDT